MTQSHNIQYQHCSGENYGYIPDEFVPEDVAQFNSIAESGRYDPTGQPAIVTWETLEPHAREQADKMDGIRAAGWIVLWWVIARFNRIPVWDSNQGNLGSCAGWAAANGHMQMVLYQMMLGAFRFVLINPLAMWARTKNWSMRGGQSMTAVMTGGNRFGNYPVELVGEYRTQLSREKQNRIIAANDAATLHQFGACRLQTADGRRQTAAELAARIILCLRAGMSVAIGNNIRVSGSRIDENGMRVAILGGTWMHATTLDGYIIVNGTIYLHWTNSHGNRYRGQDRFDSPESGCWMTVETLVQFLGGRYVDAFCIFQSEAPTDEARTNFAPRTFNQ